MWGRALVIWLNIIVAESIHGTMRVLLLAPAVGEFRARQIAVFTGIAIIFGVTWLFTPWLRAPDRASLLRVGAVWVVLTVIFEITLGLVTGATWERILSDYDLPNGGLMGLGLLAMFFTPLAAARARNRNHPRIGR